MPTRKQRKRIQKERRHEWEKVWIHPDGTDLTQITPFSDFRPRNMAWGSALAHRLANGH